MSGHAAFHVQHDASAAGGARSDRRRLLRESMRHLDPLDVKRHASKNRNIVPSDVRLNEGFVNDGRGGFTFATSVRQVLDYGDARLARVRRKITAEQKTLNRFVVHLPKSLCEEVRDFYSREGTDGEPRLDPITQDPMSRSRWIARDHAEALRYFRDAVEYLATDVIPGGNDAIHGWATNFDESTPHIQIMADPFAPDPKAPSTRPDALRTMQSQAYSSHRDVLGPDGRQLSGAEKFRDYQRGLRAHMIARGWPVEADVSARHGRELKKSEYEAARDAEAVALSALRAAHEERLDADALASQTRRIGYAALDRIEAEEQRLMKLPPVFEAFLDAVLRDGTTLRPSFERFAASLLKSAARRARFNRDLDTALVLRRRVRRPELDDEVTPAQARQNNRQFGD